MARNETAGPTPTPQTDGVGLECWCFAGFTLDVPGRVLRDSQGREVPLWRSEFALLLAFIRGPGRVLSRDHLLGAVAGRRFEGFDRSIDVLVGRLRHKIEPEPKSPRLIITVPGVGYKFAERPHPMPAPAPADETAAAAEPAPWLVRSAERRQLTVVRCGIAGGGALAATLDPEDLQPTIAAFRACCAEIVGRFGGIVAMSDDDGVVARFGYPEANELDAESAIRAALAVIAAVPKLNAGLAAPMRARVGIATGLVIIGDPTSEAAQHGQAALGGAPNLAAALLSLAQPDAVLIGASTRRLVGELFELRALKPVAVAGFADRIEIWQVSGETAGEGRFAALRAREATRLVGRDEELDLLLHRWEQAKAGSGRVVLIGGEPGIGKSRLVRALDDRLEGAAPLRIRQFCSPHHVDSTLHPVIAHLERAAGFARADATTAKLAKLEALLAPSASEEQIALIAGLLGIATGARYSLPEMTPQKRKEKTLAALLAQLRSLAAQQPVLLIYEDLQWIDSTSLELLSLTVEAIGRLPVLLLATARPEFTPPWAEEAYVTALVLGRLDRRHSAALVGNVARDKTLPDVVVDQILARSDGVPLFVEELTKAVLDAKPTADELATAAAQPDISVPASLQSSLQARLDRLGLARDVAQIGAIIGREFGYELLAWVSERPEPELKAALERLTASGLVFRRGNPPEATFLFKHALVQDAACGTLLRTERQRLHAKVADSIERRNPEVAETRPGLLARHCAEAGLAEKAVVYWLKSGQQALARSAMTEAVAELRKALGLLAGLPDGPWCRQQELDLQIALAPALAATEGFSAAAVGDTLDRARALAEQIDRPECFAPLIYAQWAFHLIRSEHRLALSLAEQLEKIGEARNDVAAQLRGRSAHGWTRCHLGEFVAARALLEDCHGLSDPAHRSVGGGLSYDPYAVMLADLAVTLAYLGYIDQAQSRLNEALSEAHRLRHAHTLALVLLWASWTESITCAPELQRRAEELLALSTEHGFPLWFGWAIAHRGRSLTVLGQAQEGLALLKQGLTTIRATGAVVRTPMLLMWLAEAYAMLGEPVEGLSCLAEAAQIIETTEERLTEADLHRVRGDLLNASGDPSAAELSYRQALSVAERQSAKFSQLRASVSLARLWRDQGKRTEARELLTPVYDWFTEGFDAPDLVEAKVLLGELGG